MGNGCSSKHDKNTESDNLSDQERLKATVLKQANQTLKKLGLDYQWDNYDRCIGGTEGLSDRGYCEAFHRNDNGELDRGISIYNMAYPEKNVYIFEAKCKNAKEEENNNPNFQFFFDSKKFKLAKYFAETLDQMREEVKMSSSKYKLVALKKANETLKKLGLDFKWDTYDRCIGGKFAMDRGYCDGFRSNDNGEVDRGISIYNMAYPKKNVYFFEAKCKKPKDEQKDDDDDPSFKVVFNNKKWKLAKDLADYLDEIREKVRNE